jgi:hypothetical protein
LELPKEIDVDAVTKELETLIRYLTHTPYPR